MELPARLINCFIFRCIYKDLVSLIWQPAATMAIVWQRAKRIFWFNFNKPHQKFGLLTQEGLHNLPRRLKRRVYIAQASIDQPPKLFLSSAHKLLSRPLISSTAAHLSQSGRLQLFHTTSPRNIHPVAWVILKPVGKVWAMLWGR